MKIMLFRHLAVYLMLLAGSSVSAQQLKFEKDSLGAVLQRAQKLQKPVCLFFVSVPPTSEQSKEKLERIYGTGLDDAPVAEVLERDFLLVKAPISTPEGQRLARRYSVSTFPTYLYLHPNGTVLHRSFANTRDPERYLRDIATFRQKLASPDNLSALEKRYRQGERNVQFLRLYLTTKRSVGGLISPELLDTYVQELPAKAFNDYSEVVFIHECGPVVESRAYKLARLNQKLVDSMYATLPLARRTAFNNLIISNTMRAAITRRDQTLAMQGAGFARGSWASSRDYNRGARAYEQNMLHYYQSLRDTAHYLPMLTRFYERYYMAVVPDTIRRQQAAQQVIRGPFQNTQPYPNLAQPDSAAKMVWVNPKARVPDTYALDLNNGAWAVYISGTRRSEYLTQAMRWSLRTIGLDPRAPYYDTLAHLLYALRLTTEAEVTQQKAIAQAKREGQSTDQYQEVLRKIKSRTL
ncbi:hypothetical protein [Hymenobacter sp. YC55]|uniref:hypothetical protein n=1 Tax=Hymenobacter sp. YC55 TaxID=3034019 RepID=UPI0023F9AB8A|nr:hypothetical protein [Hymenobacter sp. YC55]MDF7814421.1 hypothetical protein [Hymenobacter sp. YC55]